MDNLEKVNRINSEESKPRIVGLLTGEKVCLRPLNREDAEWYYSVLYHEEVRRLTGTQSYYTKEQIVQYIEDKPNDPSSKLLVIALKESGAPIGDIALQDISSNNRSASIRIAINNEGHQGKGYGREALLLMLDYGFGILNLQRIELEVFSFNERAAHVYSKIGFVREGVRRQSLYYNHQYHDTIVMSMLADEFRMRYVRGQ